MKQTGFVNGAPRLVLARGEERARSVADRVRAKLKGSPFHRKAVSA
ncbi:MAG: hypothetical protein ABW034_18260 [Steroidobacteraceae bacterium]